MRRILLLPILLFALACGGGSSLIGSDGNIYPHSMTVVVDFHNSDNQVVSMWLEDPQDANLTLYPLAAQGGRHLDTTQVWASQNEVKQFKFHSQIGANPATTVTISITGEDSYAQNFGGFDAVWSPANGLHVTTK